MASPANKSSSSSPPVPNRPNPKPRNSEAGDPLRRSFRGNPYSANTRVNIPSDFSRRNSFGGDKENETKAVPTPKGSKNFMLPTISAVYKINASPRKRVLSDKNEVSRSFSDVRGLILDDNKSHHRAKSCVSFSDVLQIIKDDKDEQIFGINGKKQFKESHDMTVTDFDENVYENKGITYSDPRFRISPRRSVQYTSPEFVAREVDTLLPPYDPENNYLSPRPQFLHYKPNPRIEKHFDECKQLEELFISETSSPDTELLTEKESGKCEEQENNGAEAVVEEETEDVEQLEAESNEEMVCESIEVTSQVPKQSGFRTFRFLGSFLALAMAYLLVSATFSPLTESPFYEFHIPKANNLEQLSEKLWTLTESSIVYMDKLISRLGGVEEYGPLQFHNLTYILEDDTFLQPTSVEINEEPLQEKSRSENNLEDVYGEVNEFEESGGEENSDVVCETKDGVAVETNEVDEHVEMKPGTDIELNEGEEGNLKALFEDGVDCNIEEQRESEVSPEEKDDARGSESQQNFETRSSKKDQEELEEAETEAIYINQHDVDSAAIHVYIQSTESVSGGGCREIAAEVSDDNDSEVRSLSKNDNDLAKAMIVSSTTILVLLAAVAFLFAKKTKHVTASTPEPAQELNLGHVPVENLMYKKLSSLNFEEEDDDRMSNSFHKKSSFHRDPRSGGGKKSNSTSSKLRRESMASSASEYSVGSFSYGSFTTYEKIPIKIGDREEEIITPVRRSSRVRNNQPCGL